MSEGGLHAAKFDHVEEIGGATFECGSRHGRFLRPWGRERYASSAHDSARPPTRSFASVRGESTRYGGTRERLVGSPEVLLIRSNHGIDPPGVGPALYAACSGPLDQEETSHSQ